MTGQTAFGGRRLPRWPIILVAAVASAVTTSMATRSQAGSLVPSGCTSIQNVPVIYNIDYGAGIQGLFNNFSNGPDAAGCIDCHTTAMGMQDPSGFLDLDIQDGSTYGNLVNVPSYEDSSILYVEPNHPEKSFLFMKVNCDNPPVPARMPRDNYGGGLSPEQQALIYDWIAEGAPIGNTGGIFRNGFDIRGFSQ
jgi:hypothetical protein